MLVTRQPEGNFRRTDPASCCLRVRVWAVGCYFPFDGNWQERHSMLRQIAGRPCKRSESSLAYLWLCNSRDEAERLRDAFCAQAAGVFVPTLRRIFASKEEAHEPQ